ncbi:hypothetical protein Syun_027950 [Stephania yunnanensis]|uniref:Uncharacterized protein n=1 Tax=Stephania yunnanensis TaxID=152371 RepID=A0AAP0EQE2_9MAGN
MTRKMQGVQANIRIPSTQLRMSNQRVFFEDILVAGVDYRFYDPATTSSLNSKIKVMEVTMQLMVGGSDLLFFSM